MRINEVGKKILEDPFLFRLSHLAQEKDIPIFLVGGFIRDSILEMDRSVDLESTCPKSPRPSGKDYDFALPREASVLIPVIEEALHLHFFKVGKEEMNTATYRIVKENISVDLTLFQGKTIEEDLQRRDFTINAAAFSLRDQTFHFAQTTLEDMADRVIRSVSNQSIDQDPLRMLRAIRYLCTLDHFAIDRFLKEAIFLKKEKIRKLPGERIKMELDQIFLSSRPEVGVRFLYEWGLLFELIPDLRNLENLGQGAHHHLDVLSHTLLMIEKILWASQWVSQRKGGLSLSPLDWVSLYYSALFHDIGKQDTYSKDEKGRVHFFHHEAFSCQRAERIMERLKFSNPLRNKTLRLIQHHMRILNLSRETKETAFRRLVYQMADETPLLALHTLADKEASRGILSSQDDEMLETHTLRILEIFHKKDVVRPPVLITGHDVMTLGYSPGPKVGQILNFIREKQVEGEIRNREEALNTLKERFKIDFKND